MARALSGNLPSRVVKASDEGMSVRQVAARFGVGVSSAVRWIAWAKIGKVTPCAQFRLSPRNASPIWGWRILCLCLPSFVLDPCQALEPD